MKILFVASTLSHVNNFHLPYMKAFKNMAYEVHILSNEASSVKYADKVFAVPLKKSLFSPANIKAIWTTYKILKREKYDKISSNTNLGGIIVRVAAMFLRSRPKIYHIVHGYSFNLSYGFSRYLYIVPERIAAFVSDVVILMNREDEEIAKKYHLYKEKLVYINGIGVDANKFLVVNDAEKAAIRQDFNLPADSYLYIYAAEFSKRKNHERLLRVFSKLYTDKTSLVLAGDGRLFEYCKALAFKLNIDDRVYFLGYVKDMPRLYAACDAAVSTSMMEGLPFNIIEAMGCGLPVVASNIKGHRELVDNDVTGFLFDNDEEFLDYLKKVMNVDFKQACLTNTNKYTLDQVFSINMNIYLDN